MYGMVKTSTCPYDELNRIQTEADPSVLIKAYAYDTNNNIQTVIATASSNSLLSAAVPNVQNPSSTEVGNPLSASLNLAPNLNENSETSEAAQSAQNTVTTPQSHVMTCTYHANNQMLVQKKAENGIDYLTKMGYDKNGNMTSRQRSSIGGPVGENTSMEVSIGTMESNPAANPLRKPSPITYSTKWLAIKIPTAPTQAIPMTQPECGPVRRLTAWKRNSITMACIS